MYLEVCYSSPNMIGYDKITFDTKAPITDACIFVQFHYVDNKWDPCVYFQTEVSCWTLLTLMFDIFSSTDAHLVLVEPLRPRRRQDCPI